MVLAEKIGKTKCARGFSMNNPSPLRYPGGKIKFYPIAREILQLNNLLLCTYIEPFAGGAGLALQLLFSGDVKQIVINDYDPHIYAFWSAVLNHNDALCSLIEKTAVTIEEWNIQKAVYKTCDSSDILKLGFATFFLNRTNVSGVLTAGVIGGKSQSGRYKLDARYCKEDLIRKIKKIAEYKSQIQLFNDDCFELFSRPEIRKLRKTFVFFDPPYVDKGAQLYKSSFKESNHIALAEKILKYNRNWIVTYDKSQLIADLYNKCRIGTWDVTYATSTKRGVSEYVIFKDNLIIPKTVSLARKKRQK